jgi:hypothetical protein
MFDLIAFVLKIHLKFSDDIPWPIPPQKPPTGS